ncbi:MAG: hypothetical protein A2Y88_12705 [Chloroflexi bacterium RBG_13_48_10]|jgi:Ca2+-binding EF-hand superfamily protein|nr:MAG: hypothetical protein A2Y88_12705 [Chloroflexi bacterium RBG_13_48_10]
MKETYDHLESLWDNLLSREPVRIREAFTSLDKPSQNTVYAHLQRMVTEAGWQPEQNLSAKVAIQALDKLLNQEETWKSPS